MPSDATRAQETLHPPHEGLPIPPAAATHSSLAYWSWVDLGRAEAGAVLGALAGAVLAAWVAPSLGYQPVWWFRAATSCALFWLWMLPLTVGCCVSLGSPVLAFLPWARATGRACAVLALGCPLIALASAAWVPPLGAGLRFAFFPLVAWPLLGLLLGVAVRYGFPAEQPRRQASLGGLLAGLGLGCLFFTLAAPLGAGEGPLARLGLHLSLLLPAAVLMAGMLHLARELGKTAWCVIIYGAHPGRLYPLSERPLTLGTAPDNVLVLPATGGVRAHHAVLTATPAGTTISALSDDAGVFLCNRRIVVSELFDGDLIQIGETVIRYYVLPRAA